LNFVLWQESLWLWPRLPTNFQCSLPNVP